MNPKQYAPQGQDLANARQPQPTPKPSGINTLVEDAVARAASLAKTTGALAYYLGHRVEGCAEAAGKNTEPSLTDKLCALHDWLAAVEENVGNIQRQIG